MEMLLYLLGANCILCLVLLVLLNSFSRKLKRAPYSANVEEDIRRIKEQII